jgi:hypothetical protein
MRAAGDRIMGLAAIEEPAGGEGLARKVERPEVALGTAGADRVPDVVGLAALPECHQPGDHLEAADARPIPPRGWRGRCWRTRRRR